MDLSKIIYFMKIRSIKSLLLSPCALTFPFLVLILFSCSKDSDGTGFSGDSGDGEIPPVVNPEDVLPEEVDGNVIVYHTLNSNVLIFEDSTVFGDLKILSNTYSSSSNSRRLDSPLKCFVTYSSTIFKCS